MMFLQRSQGVWFSQIGRVEGKLLHQILMIIEVTKINLLKKVSLNLTLFVDFVMHIPLLRSTTNDDVCLHLKNINALHIDLSLVHSSSEAFKSSPISSPVLLYSTIYMGSDQLFIYLEAQDISIQSSQLVYAFYILLRTSVCCTRT